MFNHPYICFSTNEELADNDIKSWFGAVVEAGPNGIIASAELRPDNQQQRFYRRKSKTGNQYVVVLSRDLTTDEAQQIATYANTCIPVIDFDILWSQQPLENPSRAAIKQDFIKAIALEAAKRNHLAWLHQQTNNGWRYGLKFDQKEKTSPMIKDWESLSERYQRIEYQRMSSLLNVLKEMNLIFSSKKV